MTEKKQTIHFDIEYFEGCTCSGCPVIEDLAIEVEFTDEEIALMKRLVSQIEDEDYGKGIMPVLKAAAPELYERIDAAARKEMIDYLVREGLANGYIEYDEDDPNHDYCLDVELEDNPEYTCDIPVEFLPDK